MTTPESTERPYFGECRLCGNGLLRLWVCYVANDLCLLCDECDSIWSKLEPFFEDPEMKPDFLYPDFPGGPEQTWVAATVADIEAHRLIPRVKGYSV